MATYEELKERITKSVVQKMMERKKRDTPRDNRGIPQRLKVSEAEVQRKPFPDIEKEKKEKEAAELQRAKERGGAARQRARGRGQQQGVSIRGVTAEGDLDHDAIVNEEEEEIEERKKRDNPRNDRGIPQRLKVSEAEAQRKPGSNPWQDQLDKEETEEAEEAQRAKTAGGAARQRARERGQQRGVGIRGVTSEEKEKEENLDEWYQRELYEKLIVRWTQ